MKLLTWFGVAKKSIYLNSAKQIESSFKIPCVYRDKALICKVIINKE